MQIDFKSLGFQIKKTAPKGGQIYGVIEKTLQFVTFSNA